MNLSQPVTDLCRPAENIVIIQCTFHINVGVQDDPSDTNGIKLTLYLDPHFKDVFFIFGCAWAEQQLTKIRCSGQLVHVTCIHSNPWSPRNHGQGFLAYFIIHSALGKSVSSPWVSSMSAAALIGSVYRLMSASTPLSCFIYYIKLLRPACIAIVVVVIRLF